MLQSAESLIWSPARVLWNRSRRIEIHRIKFGLLHSKQSLLTLMIIEWWMATDGPASMLSNTSHRRDKHVRRSINHRAYLNQLPKHFRRFSLIFSSDSSFASMKLSFEIIKRVFDRDLCALTWRFASGLERRREKRVFLWYLRLFRSERQFLSRQSSEQLQSPLISLSIGRFRHFARSFFPENWNCSTLESFWTKIFLFCHLLCRFSYKNFSSFILRLRRVVEAVSLYQVFISCSLAAVSGWVGSWALLVEDNSSASFCL